MLGIKETQGITIRQPTVKDHPLRDVVLAALVMAQELGEDGPAAMARATRAIVEARPDIAIGEAFQIVWNTWVI